MEFPDLILINGKIRISAASGTDVEALASTGKRVSAVGSNDAIAPLAGPDTTVIDLRGRRAVPGLIDAHCHPVKGIAAGLFAVKFGDDDAPDAIAAKLNEFIERFPHVDFVMGGRFSELFLAEYADVLKPTPREWLDKHSQGRAVYLRASSGHAAIINTCAMEYLGITPDMPDPIGGTFFRGPDGECNGVIKGIADMMSRSKWPDWTSAQYAEAVREMVRVANSFGVTGVKDADVSEGIAEAYRNTDVSGALTLRVSACLGTPLRRREVPLDYTSFEVLRDKYISPRVDTRNVKMYLDGIPGSARTAYMLEPYDNNERDNFAPDHRGQLLMDEDVCCLRVWNGIRLGFFLQLLSNDIIELDRRGFTVKIHCCGDGAIRVGLNAIAAARAANGQSGLRHELAHTAFVSDTDKPRFKELGVVADLSGYWCVLLDWRPTKWRSTI